MKKTSVLSIILSLGFATTALAGPKEKKALNIAKSKFEEIVKKTNDGCKSNLKGEFDAASFKGDPDKLTWVDGGTCDTVLGIIRTYCMHNDWKDSLVKLKTYKCSYRGKAKPSVSVKNGVVHVKVDLEQENYDALNKSFQDQL